MWLLLQKLLFKIMLNIKIYEFNFLNELLLDFGQTLFIILVL